MSKLIVSYKALEDASKQAKKTAECIGDYIAELERNICEKLDEYSGERTSHIDRAYELTKAKIGQLREKQHNFEMLSYNLIVFEENCKTADNNVKEKIQTLSADFTNTYGMEKNIVTDFFSYIGIAIGNVSVVTRYIKVQVSDIKYINDDIHKKFKEYYSKTNGKYKINDKLPLLSITLLTPCPLYVAVMYALKKTVGNAMDDDETGNVDRVETRLSNKDFLQITDKGVIYYGANQDWFRRFTQRYGGCAPTATANILAYIAMTNPELSNLYGYDISNITEVDFTKFMEEIYKYVAPLEVPIFSGMSDKKNDLVGIPSLGITSLSEFSKGVEAYARSKGVTLKSNWCSKKPSFDTAVSYIREGLRKDKPVALLNMFNPVEMKVIEPETNMTITTTYEQHWVTITGMIENKKTGEVTLEVSSWGGRATLSFNDLYNNMDWNEKFFPAGIIYFE